MDKTPWLDRPQHLKRLWRGFLLVLVLTLAAEALVAMHPAFAVESIFGFHAGFGFLACVAMIGVAKALARLLKRPDTHYRADDD